MLIKSANPSLILGQYYIAMSEDDARYRFIFDTVSKYAPTDLQWDNFKTSTELANFCDDSATLLLSCVFTKEGFSYYNFYSRTTIQHTNELNTTIRQTNELNTTIRHTNELNTTY